MIRGDNHLVLDNMRDDYVKLAQWCCEHGKPAAPQQRLTHELSNMSITLLDPLDSLPLGTGSTLNEPLACSHALQLISGSQDQSLNSRIQPDVPASYDEGAAFGSDLVDISHLLVDDPDSDDAFSANFGDSIFIQFLQRNSVLEFHVHATATDVMRLATELFPYAQLQLTMANLLRTQVGPLHYHSTALYLPASDLHLLDKMYPTTELTRPADLPTGFGEIEPTWEAVAIRVGFVLDVASGRRVSGVNPASFTANERWYLERLRPFWKHQEEEEK